MIRQAFQFHKVRLKESVEQSANAQQKKFQFHKVRLKEKNGGTLAPSPDSFNSIRYD